MAFLVDLYSKFLVENLLKLDWNPSGKLESSVRWENQFSRAILIYFFIINWKSSTLRPSKFVELWNFICKFKKISYESSITCLQQQGNKKSNWFISFCFILLIADYFSHFMKQRHFWIQKSNRFVNLTQFKWFVNPGLMNWRIG